MLLQPLLCLSDQFLKENSFSDLLKKAMIYITGDTHGDFRRIAFFEHRF